MLIQSTFLHYAVACLHRLSKFVLSCLLCFSATANDSIPQPIHFTRVFSPQEGLTKPMEKPWRDEICLNGSWEFQPVKLPVGYDVKNGAPQLPQPTTTWSSTPIRIPSPWNINAFTYGASSTFPTYPSEWDSVKMGWLRKTFRVPSQWKDKRLILHFEAISGSAQVFVNGEAVTEHFDNSTPFFVDVTDFINRDSINTVMVGVRQASLFDVPGVFGRHTYPSGSPWTREMIGIWQDVFLRALPAVRVEAVFVRPLVDKKMLELEVTIRNSTGTTQAFSLSGVIRPWISHSDSSTLLAPESKWSLGDSTLTFKQLFDSIGARTTMKVTIRQPIGTELKYWQPEHPNLYVALLDIRQADQIEDRCYQRFGWRQWGIDGRNVTLNGKPYQLLGESGHLLGVPYMTRRYAWAWYKAIKDINGNAIRLHANLRPRFYLELADEMGIAILDESEIYASTMEINYNAPETWERFHDHIDAMVMRDRNYPSVFGWSIANEILSAIWWKGTPRKYWPPVIDKVVALADRVKALDPTRPWISSDGDGDFHGRLPTYIYHYGTPEDWKRQAPKNKPFGIGEGGSMLWGSPVVFAAYNGERSYESRLGMQEGIAIECYWYLTEQRKMSAFTSIFTIAGTCFETMTLGKGNREGVILAPFAEGQPGMQPERIPVYATFNPGYDPSKPLYKPTPAFDAVKAAYAPGKPASSQWDHRQTSTTTPSKKHPTIENIAFIGDRHGDMGKALETSGVVIGNDSGAKLLVIDGQHLGIKDVNKTKLSIASTLLKGGTVMIWVDSINLENVNAILPARIELTHTHATALYADRHDPLTASIALSDLYFGDQSDPVILKNGLSGALVESSQKLIVANSFGRRWTQSLDSTKSPALIKVETDKGHFLLTTLSPDTRSAKRLKLIRSLFANLGVHLNQPSDKYNNGFDGAGFLNQALIAGGFQGLQYPAILSRDFIGNEGMVGPSKKQISGKLKWQLYNASGDGIFDFFRLGVSGTEGSRTRSQGGVLKPEALDANNYLEVIERVSGTNPGTNAVAYASFWIEAPEGVDSSDLRMLLRSDDGSKVWVNNTLIFEEDKIYGPGVTDPKSISLVLKKGWNHVMIKVGQLDGPWLFAVKFESSKPGLAESLKASAVEPPKQ